MSTTIRPPEPIIPGRRVDHQVGQLYSPNDKRTYDLLRAQQQAKLESLSDVLIAAATAGQVLEWNGTDWVNATPSSTTSTAAAASRPAAGTAGNLFLPSDGYYLERDSGAAWAPWGPVFPMTEPIIGNFSWWNQTSGGVSGTVSTTNGGMFIYAPAFPGAGAGQAPRIQEMALVAAPWTYTVALRPLGFPANYWSAGVMLRQSSNNNSVEFNLDFSTQLNLQVARYIPITTFNATLVIAKVSDLPGSPLWLRIRNDTSNLFWDFGYDGQHFQNFYSINVGAAGFVPDRVGVFADSINTQYDCGVTVFSWKQT